MRRMRSSNKARKLGSPFPLCVTSEFRTKYVYEGLFKATGRFKKTGKMNDKIQAETKEEYEKQQKVIHKRLNEQFPNRLLMQGNIRTTARTRET